MSKNYLKKFWDVDDEQAASRSFSGLFTPIIPDTDTDYTITTNADEFKKILSALRLGGRIAYPTEYGALLDAWLKIADSEGITELGSCYRMDTTTEAFSFYPNDPFVGASEKPILSGLEFKRWNDPQVEGSKVWELIEDAIGFISGYRDNDILLFPSLEAFNTNVVTNFSNYVNLFTSFPFPYVLIELEGTGQLEVELLNFPLGCAALLIPDAPTNLGDIVSTVIDYFDNDGTIPPSWILTELDRDLTPPVPELVVTQVQEFEFTGVGNHTMHVIFIPEINIAPPSINFFGGIREIEVCGDIKIIGSQTGTLYDEIRVADDTVYREGVVGTVTINDIKLGYVEGREEIARRILLARTGNVRGGVEVFEDDLGNFVTELSTSVRGALDASPDVLAFDRIYGAAFQAERDVQAAVDIIINGEDDGLSQATVALILNTEFELNESAVTDAVASYYAKLAIPEVPFSDFSTLQEFYFCNTGKGAILAYIRDKIGASPLEKHMVDFAAMWTNEQTNVWSDKGTQFPKTGYQTTACYRVPNQVYVMDASVFTGTASAINFIASAFPDTLFNRPFNKNWTYVLYVTGEFVHTPTGDTHRGFWKTISGTDIDVDIRLGENGSEIVQREAAALRSQDPMYEHFSVAYNNAVNGFRFPLEAWNAVDVTGQLVWTLVDTGQAP